MSTLASQAPSSLMFRRDSSWVSSTTSGSGPSPTWASLDPTATRAGRFLLVGPGFTGDLPSSGYHIVRAPLHNYNVMVRGILKKGMGDAPETVQTVKQLRVYPWSERTHPEPTRFISISGVAIDTLPPHGMEFWSRLSAFINNNPVQERDLFYMGMLKPLGLEKGKPFEPDARQRAILEEAARIGDAIGRVMLFMAPNDSKNANRFPARSGSGCSRSIRCSRPTVTARSTSDCTTPTARSTPRPRWV